MSQTTHNLLSGQADTAELTESERHRLLEHDRRRHALAVVAEATQPLDLEEMAVAVAEHEHGVDADDPSTVDRVATTLHHIHLPKMAEAGVVGYDPVDNRVEP